MQLEEAQAKVQEGTKVVVRWKKIWKLDWNAGKTKHSYFLTVVKV